MQGLTRLPVTQKIAGSIPVRTAIFFGSIAQSVEQGTENPCVAGSIPAGATIFVLNPCFQGFYYAQIYIVFIFCNTLLCALKP